MDKKNNKRTERLVENTEKGRFSARQLRSVEITFKKPDILKRFLSPRYKILPSSKTGLSAKKQRKLTDEVKKARFLALIPFTDRHFIG